MIRTEASVRVQQLLFSLGADKRSSTRFAAPTGSAWWWHWRAGFPFRLTSAAGLARVTASRLILFLNTLPRRHHRHGCLLRDQSRRGRGHQLNLLLLILNIATTNTITTNATITASIAANAARSGSRGAVSFAGYVATAGRCRNLWNSFGTGRLLLACHRARTAG